MKKGLSLLIALAICTSLTGQEKDHRISWNKIDTGLYLANYLPPGDTVGGEITILKIDPAFYDFSLHSAKEAGEESRTVQQWANDYGLVAVINAGMYQEDGVTNVGYMRNFGFVNNGKLNKNNAILAFNRKSTNDLLPSVQIIDLQCQYWQALKDKYNSYTQSIRMVDCHQKNCWSKQDKHWSIAAIGIDKQGNVLFLFSRYPYTVHDFIDTLLEAPINLFNAMYLEGGPPASLYINTNGTKLEQVGSYESLYFETYDNDRFWPLPNVIGVRRK
jgi:uncharacterized protein YigE (DUF2233 family)